MAIKKEKKSEKTEESTVLRGVRLKRKCFFCESKTQPTYTDSVALRRFLSDRSKIIPKMRTGACSRHQRQVSKQIKYARHLSLLPFITRV